MKKQNFFLGSGRRSYFVLVFLLEVCEWLKCRDEFDWLANGIGESLTESVSGRSNDSQNFIGRLKF